MDFARAARIRVPVITMTFANELHGATAIATLSVLPTKMRFGGWDVCTSVGGGHARCSAVNCTT
eukprot:7774896-Pyramimonas_sp.AAC.1